MSLRQFDFILAEEGLNMVQRYKKYIGMGLCLAVLSLGFAHDAAAQKRTPDATASITLTSLSFIGGHGVEMELFSVTMGADLTLAAQGLRVKMDK